jgi:hypothetical protein
MVIANPNNFISKELSKAGKSAKKRNAIKYEGLHDEYISHPKAQYVMSFLEYKKLKRNKRKFANWVNKNPFAGSN